MCKPNFTKLAAGLFLLSAIAASMFSATPVQAQRDFSKIEVRTSQVSENISMLQGAGGNISILSGVDGLLMVDADFAQMSAKVLAAVRAISNQPIKFLLNTHWHGDHVGGNAAVGQTGAVIVAHENGRKLMSAEQFMRAFNRRVPASPKVALPVVTFMQSASFEMNGETVTIRHTPSAHTDGDAFVYYEKVNVIHAGDTFFNGFYPFIDTQNNGGIDGVIHAANEMLKLANDQTKIIPGHGPLGDRTALTAYRDTMIKVRDRVAAGIAGNQTPDRLVAADPLADLNPEWGNGFLKADRFIRIVYAGMKK